MSWVETIGIIIIIIIFISHNIYILKAMKDRQNSNQTLNTYSYEKYLLKDEKIIWSGQPDIKIIFSNRDKFYIPLIILLFVIIIYLMCLYDNFGLVLILPFIAYYFLIGRFKYKKHKRKNTYYAVTNQRILLIDALQWEDKGYTGMSIKDITHIEKEISRNGSGTIRFGYKLLFPKLIFGTPAPTFFDIKDAEKVYQIVMEQKRFEKN